jgi:uncharacterized RDD family membrane protein YckC
MEEWYYAINGVQQGPVSREALIQMLVNGQVAGDSLVWREGMGDWLPASRVPELVNIARLAPHVSPQHQNSPQLLAYGVGESVYQSTAGPLPYAGFWIRFVAWLIDFILLMCVQFVSGIFIGFLAVAGSSTNGISRGINDGAGFIGLLVGWLYFALMTSSSKQATLGMMAFGLRVTDLYGRRISFGRATGRHFAAILSGCLFCVGYLMIAFTEKKQALHDQIAGTLVLNS